MSTTNKQQQSRETIVPDTSVIIDGRLTEGIAHDEIHSADIVVPEFVINELEHQANKGKETGDAGLAELTELRELVDARSHLTLTYTGRKPTQEEIQLAHSGRIDALIRDVAEEQNATLYTSDIVLYKMAVAKGIAAHYFEKEEEVSFSLDTYFDTDTMSVHLKKEAVPLAKKGSPGNVQLQAIGEEPLSSETVEQLMKEIIETAKSSEHGHVEMSKNGVMVIQLEDYRIVIATPPFAETAEITAVKPVARLSIDEYNLSSSLKERLREQAEGVLIAGSPGHGKSTFAQALIDYYWEQGHVVKTMEHPRDLKVDANITQYSALDSDFANTAEILLLLRPDYTVFDEVRKTQDFSVFADLRLSGVGLIGVVHATAALDAVQRLIGRVELGIIPHVVDTVIYIQDAGVAKVYSLQLTVKVPAGMNQEDLARPVVQVIDFETGSVEYEIYTFGEENVIIPVDATQESDRPSARDRYAAAFLENELEKYVANPTVEFVSDDRVTVYVNENDMAHLIGKEGKRIEKIESKLDVNISVEPREGTLQESIAYEVEERGKYIAILVAQSLQSQPVDVYDKDTFLFTATVGKKGQVKLSKDASIANHVLGAHARGSLRVYT